MLLESKGHGVRTSLDPPKGHAHQKRVYLGQIRGFAGKITRNGPTARVLGQIELGKKPQIQDNALFTPAKNQGVDDFPVQTEPQKPPNVRGHSHKVKNRPRRVSFTGQLYDGPISLSPEAHVIKIIQGHAVAFSVHQVTTGLWHHFTRQIDVISLNIPSHTEATSELPSKDDPLLLEWLNSEMSTLHNASHTFSHPQFTLETFQVQQILQTAPKLEYLSVFDHPTGHRTAWACSSLLARARCKKGAFLISGQKHVDMSTCQHQHFTRACHHSPKPSIGSHGPYRGPTALGMG